MTTRQRMDYEPLLKEALKRSEEEQARQRQVRWEWDKETRRKLWEQ
jgi:hypothetical protein